jgi:hypothetical protein
MVCAELYAQWNYMRSGIIYWRKREFYLRGTRLSSIWLQNVQYPTSPPKCMDDNLVAQFGNSVSVTQCGNSGTQLTGLW